RATPWAPGHGSPAVDDLTWRAPHVEVHGQFTAGLVTFRCEAELLYEPAGGLPGRRPRWRPGPGPAVAVEGKTHSYVSGLRDRGCVRDDTVYPVPVRYRAGRLVAVRVVVRHQVEDIRGRGQPAPVLSRGALERGRVLGLGVDGDGQQLAMDVQGGGQHLDEHRERFPR